ncbi:uncharacterized protein C8A04DRAFT_9787, partial [Dichotomopilus funicola]
MPVISPYPPEDLLQAEKTLMALAEDPELLDMFRGRFGKPLPPPPSLASTQFPLPITAAQQRYNQKSLELYSSHGKSAPYDLFNTQVTCLRYGTLEPVFKPQECSYGTPVRDERDAKEMVKARWIEQGIWDDGWNDKGFPSGFWKHENRRFDWDLGEIVYGTPIQKEPRDVEASRPYHQFIYLVSKERENIREELRTFRDAPPMNSSHPPTRELSGPGEAVKPSLLDINTQAYERIKAWWIRTGIWDDRWGVLPGMKWKHETPVQELVKEIIGEYPANDVVLEPNEDEMKLETPPP